jgi:hypothetical protein
MAAPTFRRSLKEELAAAEDAQDTVSETGDYPYSLSPRSLSTFSGEVERDTTNFDTANTCGHTKTTPDTAAITHPIQSSDSEDMPRLSRMDPADDAMETDRDKTSVSDVTLVHRTLPDDNAVAKLIRCLGPRPEPKLSIDRSSGSFETVELVEGGFGKAKVPPISLVQRLQGIKVVRKWFKKVFKRTRVRFKHAGSSKAKGGVKRKVVASPTSQQPNLSSKMTDKEQTDRLGRLVKKKKSLRDILRSRIVMSTSMENSRA